MNNLIYGRWAFFRIFKQCCKGMTNIFRVGRELGVLAYEKKCEVLSAVWPSRAFQGFEPEIGMDILGPLFGRISILNPGSNRNLIINYCTVWKKKMPFWKCTVLFVCWYCVGFCLIINCCTVWKKNAHFEGEQCSLFVGTVLGSVKLYGLKAFKKPNGCSLPFSSPANSALSNTLAEIQHKNYL